MNTCCPSGYYYNGVKCCPNGVVCDIATSTGIPTIPCGCCPEGYLYIDNSGYYQDPTYGSTLIVNNPSSTPSFLQCLGQCGQFSNHAYASAIIGSIGCPCCPSGFSYDSKSGTCLDGKGAQTQTISCIPVICPTPVDPPPCPTCNNGSAPISFSFNPTQKNCTDCELPDDSDTRPFTRFIADTIINPIINFFRS